uniref:Uncharacterized protein n=1 Tax=Pipistrellus kuhlii TaxID=59472 RepID=A0A7J7ZKA8_PIPKU|nr:hypothetical protein mPipKuh1_009595 [Pipistrellus kuhlii]
MCTLLFLAFFTLNNISEIHDVACIRMFFLSFFKFILLVLIVLFKILQIVVHMSHFSPLTSSWPLLLPWHMPSPPHPQCLASIGYASYMHTYKSFRCFLTQPPPPTALLCLPTVVDSLFHAFFPLYLFLFMSL